MTHLERTDIGVRRHGSEERQRQELVGVRLDAAEALVVYAISQERGITPPEVFRSLLRESLTRDAVIAAAQRWRQAVGPSREIMVFGAIAGEHSRALIAAVDALDGDKPTPVVLRPGGLYTMPGHDGVWRFGGLHAVGKATEARLTAHMYRVDGVDGGS